MNWFTSIIRIAGSSFPLSASLVQLQAEIDHQELLKRLEKLEDPISFLHHDIPEVCKHLYVRATESCEYHYQEPLTFEESFYSKYKRALALLEGQNYIDQLCGMGAKVPLQINFEDPTFVLYCAMRIENDNTMSNLIEIVDKCIEGQSLNGYEISKKTGLPVFLLKSVFVVFESKNYGYSPKTLGSCEYIGTA